MVQIKKDKKKSLKRSIRKDKISLLPARSLKIFALGIVVLFIGYIFMMQGPADSFWSRTLAPLVLIIGYCVIIPIAILFREKKR